MKRDKDLIREILLQIENYGEPRGWLEIEVDGYSPEEVSYHVELLSQAGYIQAKDLSNNTKGHNWKPVTLPWEGHNFLDAARDESIWKKAKEELGEKFQSVTLPILKELLLGYLRVNIGL